MSAEGDWADVLIERWQLDDSPEAWEKVLRLLDDMEAAPLIAPWNISREVEGAHRTRMISIGNPILSGSQLTILRELAKGKTYKEIASSRGTQVSTVRTHAQRAMARLGARTTEHAISIAIGLGLFDPEAGIATEGRYVVTAKRPTDVECRILERLVKGDSNEDIAARLDFSPETVKAYVARLLHLFHARNRTHLVAIAIATGILRFVSSRHTEITIE